MTRIRWYGPTLVLLITVLLVLIGGPPLARQLAFEYDKAHIVQVRNTLKQNPSLAELSAAFKAVAKVVEKSVVSIEVYSKRPQVSGSELPDDLRQWLLPDRDPFKGKRDDKDGKKYEVSFWLMSTK